MRGRQDDLTAWTEPCARFETAREGRNIGGRGVIRLT